MWLEWDGHELLSLNIVGKSKWVDHALSVCELRGGREKGDHLRCFFLTDSVCRKYGIDLTIRGARSRN